MKKSLALLLLTPLLLGCNIDDYWVCKMEVKVTYTDGTRATLKLTERGINYRGELYQHQGDLIFSHHTIVSGIRSHRVISQHCTPTDSNYQIVEP